ncbi:hypothetical protein D1BOALGB6SA_2138 [Olavius sp. associated proteobacterium Delta 1]|nr:hypothetical protein D1BOALGB6SA_2138 [Olavius sp. associated proteobacterium Delta 1]
MSFTQLGFNPLPQLTKIICIMPREVDAITKLYDYLLWMIPKLDKYPRSQKFLLADRIETLLLDILELLIDAAYSKNKYQMLRSANLKLEKLRCIGKKAESTASKRASSFSATEFFRLIGC